MKNKMYHLSLEFDQKTNERFTLYSNQIEKSLHQNYLKIHQIPFHLTIATYQEINEKEYIQHADRLFKHYKKENLYFASIGCFNQSTLYLLPIYNEFLNQLVNDCYKYLNEYTILSKNNRYLPNHAIYHVSLTRKLSEEQTNKAFVILNHSFQPFFAKAEHLVLAKTNPYEKIKTWVL